MNQQTRRPVSKFEVGKYVVPPKEYGVPGSKTALSLLGGITAGFLLYRAYMGGRLEDLLPPSIYDRIAPYLIQEVTGTEKERKP